MSTKIKLIWDFRGPDSKELAKHHAVHLKEFSSREALNYLEIGSYEINPMYAIAFVTVAENEMKVYRDSLKPHRGELA